MYSQILSGSLYGLNSEQVIVETDLSPGLPAFNVVGLPDTTVKESKERIRAAIVNSGYKFPAKRIIINLSPAGTRKEGTHFDLPIALGVMASVGYIDKEKASKFAFLGELSLDGRVNRINGALPLVIGLRNQGIENIILPMDNAEEAAAIVDVKLYPVNHLNEIAEFFQNKIKISQYKKSNIDTKKKNRVILDFNDVAGHDNIKRALQISAAASHNLLMIGPPGSGKTMMAKRVPGILPDLTYEEKLEITKIYSIIGKLTPDCPIITERPFRTPHHTISGPALVGGGASPKPGEVSLAHFGVLFPDELPEFNRNTLEMLRQPIEDERVVISRNRGSVSYPAKFMLLASMNPCPCGYYGDPAHECTCSHIQIRNYLSKISGPLMDRFDMHIEVMPVQYRDLEYMELLEPENPEFRHISDKAAISLSKDSATMKSEVESARQIQLERYKSENISYNSQLSPGQIKKYCTLDKETKKMLEDAFTRLSLSARAYNKIIKMGRTIADLEGAEKIRSMHIAEAIQYRSLDKMYRGL